MIYITFIFVFIFSLNNSTKLDLSNNEITGLVVDYKKKESYTSITIKVSGEKVLCYVDSYDYSVGDTVTLHGKFTDIKDKSYDADFSFKNYLNYNNIYTIFNSKKMQKNDVSNNLYYGLRYKIFSFYEEKLTEPIFKYVKTLVFGINEIDDDFNGKTRVLGISHFFQVSGFHISLLVIGLSFILSKIFINNRISENIIISVLIFYLYMCNFQVSVLRAVSVHIILILTKRYKLDFTTIDILSISVFVVLIFNIKSIFTTSFILSYLLSYTIILNQNIINSPNKLFSNIKLSLICFLVSMPIIINMNNEVNLLSFIFCVLIGYVMSFIMMPYSYICIIIPFIPVLNIFSYFDKVITYLSNISFLTLKVGSLNIYFVMIYYFFLVYLLTKIDLKSKGIYKYILFSILFYVCLNTKIFMPFYEVTIVDVGQGDSIFISSPMNKSNILIDAYSNVDKFLKTKGIDKIDNFFITHSDKDHIGSLDKIVKNYKVDNLYTNMYETYSIANARKVNSNSVLSLQNFEINILSMNKKYTKVNNNSLVFILKLYEYKFMFTGDIEKEAENDISVKYKEKLRSDFLKVGHHGSSTSSSSNFIQYVLPTESFVSCGKNNFYGHPNDDALLRLNKSNIYRTDVHGNITVKIYKNRYKVDTYK
ncbi:MAG: DNA internalization-related competence protein ComEC/Rec2 [Anaeroplasmataceae bacterium]